MPATERDTQTGASPVARMVAQLEGGPFYTIQQASDITTIPTYTLRRWARSRRVKAPSKQVTFGRMKVWLYTPADLQELRGESVDPVIEDRLQ